MSEPKSSECTSTSTGGRVRGLETPESERGATHYVIIFTIIISVNSLIVKVFWMVFLITLAKLGREDGPTGMEERLDLRAEILVAALGLERETMPDRVTISRLLGQAVAVEEFEQVLQRYFDGQAQLSQAVVIAIYGKTLRGTIAPGQSQGLHLRRLICRKKAIQYGLTRPLTDFAANPLGH